MIRRRDFLAAAGGSLLVDLLAHPAGAIRVPGVALAAASPEIATVRGRQAAVLAGRVAQLHGFIPDPHGGGYLLPPGARGALTSGPIDAAGGVTALGAHWQGLLPPRGRLQVLVRWREQRGAWSGWTPLPGVSAGEGDAHAAQFAGPLFLARPAVAVQARLQAQAAGPASGYPGPPLRLVSATLALIQASAAPTQGPARFRRLAASQGLTILPRVAWGCPPGEQSPDWVPFYQDPTHFVVHHTEGPNSGPGPLAQLRSVWYFHTFVRGWGDIGYNYLIDRQGIVYEGRAGGPGVVGAHAEYYNSGTIGIALLGSYQVVDPPREMMLSLARLIALLARQNGIDPRGIMGGVDGRRFPGIVGHRDVYATFCPGDRVYRLLPLLRSAF